MNQNRVTKMYDGLTNKERAALAFHYLTDANELELKRVEASVPVKLYRCPDLDYLDWLDSFFNMAALWAIEHWQMYSRSLTALVALHINCDNLEKEKSIIEVHAIWESRLLALDCALLVVCDEHGIDPNRVRRLAGTKAFSPMSARTKPDADYQADMQVCLARLLEHSI